MKTFKTSIFIFLLTLFTSQESIAQATFTQGNSANQLATELSTNGGFTITNQVLTSGGNRQRGIFSNGTNAGLTLDRGILLTTGRVNRSLNNMSSTQGDDAEQGGATYIDTDLTNIDATAINDVVIYEFDFKILGTEPKIFALDYQFASEEYPDYVCANVNDIFGFFISGGDLTGSTNLAQVGGTNVAVNYVNSGTVGFAGDASANPCVLNNANSFVVNYVLDDNFTPGDPTDDFLDIFTDGPHHIMYNGFTTKLRAYTILRPGIDYHMKMAIADVGDDIYDSGVFVAPINIYDLPPKSDIDFDGVDDYVNTQPFFGGFTGATMMSWLKLDSGFSATGDVCGQKNFKIFVDGSRRLKAQAKIGGTTLTTPNGSAPVLNRDLWYHATAKYDGSAGTLTLFLNGEQVWQGTGLGANLNASDDTHDFAIGFNAQGTNRHFRGNIDEVRVYDIALNDNQIQEQVYQEVENVGGAVTGSTIPKGIDGGSIAWSDLRLYYNMDLIYDVTLIDNSPTAKNGVINNITTVQAQTAPLPYRADNSGTWTTTGTWEHGSVWDVTTLPNKDWAIVEVTNNAKVTTTASHNHLGLIVDTGSELEMQNDQSLQNTKYLRLDGQIDLVGESQLIQTAASQLDVASAGYIERDQQGKSDMYEYNHWSSPVSTINNTANNTDYTVASVLRDGTNPLNPQPINFVGGYDAPTTSPISLAEYWIFKFLDHPDDYNNWFNGHVQSTGAISVGEGYTQKGSGAGSANQNYVFVGKPNNGVIQHFIGGENLYLVGNPYPSAIDANQFILDNIVNIESAGDVIGSGTTTGALYFWEHWGGNSHALADYQGGYATYNLTGATLAVPDPDVSGTGSGSTLPRRYIPVGQGFFVQGSLTGGSIEFNNGQRVFQREMDGNSVFISKQAAQQSPEADEIDRVYFRFTTPEGPQRQLLLGVKSGLPDGINYGYDAEMLFTQHTDCAWKANDKNLVIQTIGAIYDDLELPLEIKVGTSGICRFETEGLQDLEDNVELFFIDKERGLNFPLQIGSSVELELEEGTYNNRFYISFKVKEDLQQTEEQVALDDLVIFSNNTNHRIEINASGSFSLSSLRLYNVLAQEVVNFERQFRDVTTIHLPVNVASGTYILKGIYNDATTFTKKLVIKK